MFTPLKTKPEQLYCLLFTDGILFCEEKKRKNKESKLMMKYKFGLEEILLAAETDLHVFSCVNRLNKYLVNLVFPNQRNEWIKVLSNLMSRLPLFGLSRSSSEREMKTFETMRKKYLEFSQLLPVAVPGSNITVPQETIVKSDPDTQRKSVNFGKVAELKQIFGPSPSREEKEKRRKQYFSESSTL